MTIVFYVRNKKNDTKRFHDINTRRISRLARADLTGEPHFVYIYSISSFSLSCDQKPVSTRRCRRRHRCRRRRLRDRKSQL